jgi:Reverse transcriptase (RNA-dependent DNA polymerase)
MVVSSPSPRRRRPLVVDVTFCVHPGIRFERYADDAICHCTSEAEASALHRSLEERFADCGLTLHPEKTGAGRIPTKSSTFSATHVWNEIVRLLEDPSLIQCELDRRLSAARTRPIRQNSGRRRWSVK